MATSRVAAVVVAHASGSWLAQTLESLREQTYPGLRVQVVAIGDVDVPEGSQDVVRLAASTGFAEAVNVACRQLDADVRYVLTLHDDVHLDPGAVAAMVERADQDPDVAAVGAKLVEWDTPEILQEVGGSVDRFGRRRSRLETGEVDHGQHDDTDDAVFASAACLLVDRESLDAFGGFDAGAWPTYEDVDLCWRLRAAGRRVVVAPAARVRHVAALSRGLRAGAEPGLGAIGLGIHTERGTLRFMLKNYEPIGLAIVVPQYMALALWHCVASVARRQLWRIRCIAAGWARVFVDLPRVMEARRAAPPRAVADHEILALASRHAASARRVARVATLGEAADAVGRLEERLIRVVKHPVTWGATAAIVILLATMWPVVWGSTFTLGQVRELPTLAEALGAYQARVRPEGLDPLRISEPGLLLLGLLRSLPLVGAALAQKILLLGPLVVVAAGGVRLGGVLGLGGVGKGWLAIASAVNPVTLQLATQGRAGALVAWAASPWLLATFLAPPPRGEELRRWSRWILAWAVVVALHPPALLWLAALGGVVTLAAAWDGQTRARARHLAIGVAGSVVVSLPWSLQWFSATSPLAGRDPWILAFPREGIHAATFGAGWVLIVAAAVAVGSALLVGMSRLSLGLSALLAATWLAGVAWVIPADTALVATGFTTLVVLACSARALREELPRLEFGWRQASVGLMTATLAAVWILGAGTLVFRGVQPHTVAVVPPPGEAGRVLWLLPGHAGTTVWATDGFREAARSWPGPTGPGNQLALDALEAARTGRTHRAGALLALADVSHVVALASGARAGLVDQADMAPGDVQGRVTIFQNHAWLGQAQLLASAPADVLTPEGLAAAVRSARRVEVDRTNLIPTRLTPPEDAEDGVIYVAAGAHRGWSVDGAQARPAAAGFWIPADAVEGTAAIQAPAGWWRVLYPVQLLVFAGLVLTWVGSAYLARPGVPRSLSTVQLPVADTRALMAVVPAGLLVAALWLGFAPSPGAAAPLLSSAWYCPPVGDGPAQRLAIANPSPAQVPYVVREHVLGPAVASGTLEPLGRATVTVDASIGGVVEAYGEDVAVGSIVSARDHSDTTHCASEPHTVAVFAEGGRLVLGDPVQLRTLFVVHNPFPEPARVSVRLFTPDEAIAPPAFQDLTIEPGAALAIDPEDQLEPTVSLGAQVEVWRGRAVVSRRMRRSGIVWWSLGASPAPGGVAAWAQTLDASSRIMAVNPGDRPARLTLEVTGDVGTLPETVIDLLAGGRRTVRIEEEEAQDQSELIVRVSSDVPLGIESLVIPDEGRPLAFPLMQPARSWVLPAAEGRRLVITNPSTGPASVRVTRLGPGPRIADESVGPSGVTIVDLEGDEPFGLLVESDEPVVVAVLGAPGSSVGIPLRTAER